MTPRIRDLGAKDVAAVLTINNAAAPAMNILDLAAFESLRSYAAYARVVETEGRVKAFLLALPPGAGYESANYRWFCEQFAHFLYIDRVAVAGAARGLGYGSALYDDLAAFASGTWPRIVAEVNLDPPNPRSVAFHERHGFARVGELQHAYEGAHATRVLLMQRVLA